MLPPSGTKTAVGAEEQMDVDVQASTPAAAEEDLYTRLKTLQRQLEFLEIQVGIMLAPLEVPAWSRPLQQCRFVRQA